MLGPSSPRSLRAPSTDVTPPCHPAPVRVASFTDVHADVHSLRAALQRIDTLRCDHVVCGGDLVDYGHFPSEAIALLRERGIPCVRGNHDRWAASDMTLSGDERRWLLALPRSWGSATKATRSQHSESEQGEASKSPGRLTRSQDPAGATSFSVCVEQVGDSVPIAVRDPFRPILDSISVRVRVQRV